MESINEIRVAGEVTFVNVNQTTTGKSVGNISVKTELDGFTPIAQFTAWEENADKLNGINKGDKVKIVGHATVKKQKVGTTDIWVSENILDKVGVVNE